MERLIGGDERRELVTTVSGGGREKIVCNDGLGNDGASEFGGQVPSTRWRSRQKSMAAGH